MLQILEHFLIGIISWLELRDMFQTFESQNIEKLEQDIREIKKLFNEDDSNPSEQVVDQ